MARGTTETRTETRLPSEEMQAAYDVAMRFPIEQVDEMRFTPAWLMEKAHEEAAFGKISIDADGLTPGTRLHVIEPARALLSRWHQTRRRFDVAIEPKMRGIQAVRDAEADTEAARSRAARDRQDAEDRLDADQGYIRVRNEFREAETRYQRLRTEHENRDANMMAYNPAYWLALLCIGVAEWLINYDVFFLFANVVAIAAGATIIMGVLLAFAAHGHGMLFKQWSYRFGEHRDVLDRRGDWRMLALSTFSLLIVLGAATGSRYAAVMHQIAGQPQVNILGSEASIAVDPMRDVLLSLLWNVMAWAVGVFIAYMAHDKDPDYMGATWQYQRAHRRYTSRRRPLVNRIRQIEARLAKEIERLEAAARTKAADTMAERDLLSQVDAHESALVNALAAVTGGNAQTYRANLAQLAASQRGGVTIERVGPNAGEISVADFRNEHLNITPDTIRRLS
ncbi:MAG: hypothetical protein B7Z80_02310 [Rhodospirillales bacterium 20-64-7]|nr:MAG: hypothetical protein B7Z80_02310 [Rhodospirillales bacterium 20-64-7]HQT76036.1 hypothetical protein [Rhodopila sp.]